MTYIALLRGINVGGHTVPMEKLRAIFTEMGFTNVRSYIQTGNVFFDCDETTTNALADQIASHLETALGYAVPTCVRTIAELEECLNRSPFAGKTPAADERFCIAFAPHTLTAPANLPVFSLKRDVEIVACTNSEAFVIWHLQDGRAPQYDQFMVKAVGSVTTTRFYHTTQKILDAAKN